MWLINVETLKLEYIVEMDPAVHKYAILSHCWGNDEVAFSEMNALQLESSAISTKAGFEKIRRCCERAKTDGYGYAWVDTCCIDKTSSAELSESINSMFRWYQLAQVCYVFMDDVPDHNPGELPEFSLSRWFTRGWTLQELIAPTNIVFFSMNWSAFGTKASLIARLASITEIDSDVLLGTANLYTVSVARRMSWAAHRKTTRAEDIAYCLLGIFDINMAMLYGEGQKAFLRLQEEIARTSDDHTLFAWADPTAAYSEERGVLAPHPRCFQHSGHLVPSYRLMLNRNALRITPSSRGLAFRACIWYKDPERCATLSCMTTQVPPRFAYIVLNETNGSYVARIKASYLGYTHADSTSTEYDASEICIPQHPERFRGVDSGEVKWFKVFFGSKVPDILDIASPLNEIRISPETLMVSDDDLAHLSPTLLADRWNPLSKFHDLLYYKFSLLKASNTILRFWFRKDDSAASQSVCVHIGGNDTQLWVGCTESRWKDAPPEEIFEFSPDATRFSRGSANLTINDIMVLHMDWYSQLRDSVRLMLTFQRR